MTRKNKGAPVKGYRKKGAGTMTPYKTCRIPASMVPFYPPWQGLIHMYRKDVSDPSTLQRTLAPFAVSRYGMDTFGVYL
jgi:hypothetical protein